MKISLSWLKEWVVPESAAFVLAEKLTYAGLEVESAGLAGCDFDSKRLVVGEITAVKPHPHADRLTICTVHIGRKRPVSIVCGAPNVCEGAKVAVALKNARLRDVTVSDRVIHGMKSSGMLCSAAELGLSEQSDDLMIFDAEAPVGQQVSRYLDLSDFLFGLELTPNRGDCLSIRGIAREISALEQVPLNPEKTNKAKKTRPANQSSLSIELDAPEACPRFVGRAVGHIDMKAKTPDWMASRLRKSGLRSINAIVDVTNYVMLEYGQPMHAFDLDRLHGGLCVRMAKPREKLVLLDDREITLRPDFLVIADAKRAVALAGIMGGVHSAISENTQNVYLEAAFFAPSAIIGKARHFGLHTEASHRFERGVDSRLQQDAMERATELIVAIAGGEPGPVSHVVSRPHVPRKKSIRLDTQQITRTLGVMIPPSETSAVLQRLGMEVRTAPGGWRVTPPSWRFDLVGAHDLVEEVGRCYGYDRIEPTIPTVEALVGQQRESDIPELRLKQQMVARGYREVVTYSFVDSGMQDTLLGTTGSVSLRNPISEAMSVMRKSLWPGLLEVVRNNLNRQEDCVRLFEVGHVFTIDGDTAKIIETGKVAAAITGLAAPKQWATVPRDADFFDLKGDLEALFFSLGIPVDCMQIESGTHTALHPGRIGVIRVEERTVGHIGQLHPIFQNAFDIAQPVFLMEADQSVFTESAVPLFRNLSRFPSVQRDIAVLVDRDVEADKLLQSIRSTGGQFLRRLELFDIYQGEQIEKNKKSFAFSLTFQSESSNLISSEVDLTINKILKVLMAGFGATLRT